MAYEFSDPELYRIATLVYSIFLSPHSIAAHLIGLHGIHRVSCEIICCVSVVYPPVVDSVNESL